jgi:2,3-bisphosphoglycerate-dependent phosphoglycerate mutase
MRRIQAPKKDHCHHPLVMIDDCVIGEHGKPKPVGDKWCCDGFIPPERTLIFAARHGEDENDELIGGWEDVPIDDAGTKDAHEIAEFLKGKGVREIIASDMKRTRETAKIVAKELGIKNVTTDFRLRTWNKGIYNGEEKTAENKADLGWYKDHPHAEIPEGESHDQFEERHNEAFDYYLDEARHSGVKLLLLHNSGIKQLQRYCRNEPITSEQPDSVLPGGIAKVTEKDSKLTCTVVLKDKPNSGHK